MSVDHRRCSRMKAMISQEAKYRLLHGESSQKAKKNPYKLLLVVLAALVICASVYGIYKLVDVQTPGGKASPTTSQQPAQVSTSETPLLSNFALPQSGGNAPLTTSQQPAQVPKPSTSETLQGSSLVQLKTENQGSVKKINFVNTPGVA
eukprot:179115_1